MYPKEDITFNGKKEKDYKFINLNNIDSKNSDCNCDDSNKFSSQNLVIAVTTALIIGFTLGRIR